MTRLVELERSQINTFKWNELINRANNGLIYHTIPYLDAMTNNWSGLIMGDYEFAFPLVRKKILGYNFLQQPPFTQQLGLIGNDINIDIFEIFLKYLIDNFAFIHYSLNFNNTYTELYPKKNFILTLHHSYDFISNQFNDDAKSNIKKSHRYPFTYKKNTDSQKTILQYRNIYGKRFSHVKINTYMKLNAFCQNNDQHWISREVYLRDQLCASCLLLRDSKRLYFIINNVTTFGRNIEANYFMIDELIREFSDSDLILDFEGSDLPGVSEFYQKFGAINQPYYELRKNSLPFLLKILKK